jgi:hypothetical protein
MRKRSAIMPTWLVFALMAVWGAGCVAALWQHFRPGLVFYGVFAAVIIALPWLI